MSDEPQKTHAGMPCPVCKIDLLMSERQGVEIDYCPKCRGVWLDRGELDKIIELSDRPQASGSQLRPNPVPQPQLAPGFLPQQGGPWATSHAPQGYTPYNDHFGGHGGHGGGHGNYGGHDAGGFLSRLFR